MNERREKSIPWIIIGSCFALFVYGFVDNLKGATLPFMIQDLHFNYTQGGAIQQGAYMGFLFASMATGFLISFFGHRSVLLGGAVCLVIGILGYSFFSGFSLLLVSMIIIGLGMGALDLGGVRLIVDFYGDKKGKYLNLSAFFHGLAAMLAPIFSVTILNNGLHWRSVYHFGIISVLFFVLFLLLVRISKPEKLETFRASSLQLIWRSLIDRSIWFYYVLIICYVAIENGYAVWIVEYLQKARGQSSETSIANLSLFFFFLMIGRLVGSFIVEKLGYLRMLLIASFGASVCLALGIFGPNPLIFCLPLAGFFLSIIFPTATAAASNNIHRSKDVQLAMFFAFAGLGGMIGSGVIGYLSDIAGIQTGFGFFNHHVNDHSGDGIDSSTV